MSSSLSAILQRFPAISHVLMLIIALYGPGNFPLVFATIYFGVHVVLSANNILSIWGQFCAWRGVEATCSPKTYKRHDIEHIIIIPAYKEDLEILRETLDTLGSHVQTRDQYRICLAMECRETGSEKKALQLEIEYQEAFGSIEHSMHPVIAGEAPGKSSNVNWAARHMAAKFDATEQARQVITVIDSDTCLAQDYFQMVAERFMAFPPAVRAEMMFCVPIIFDRNAHEVPIFVRIVDILWAQAGLSTTYPTSDIKIPTSVYGISMQLANNIGFWDTGPEAIGEDMHMFAKCFLSTGGNLKVETIYSPASQLNVVGSRHSEGGIVAWVSDMCARYNQGMRHMWGSLDSGYVLRRIITGDFGDGPVNWLAMMNLVFRLFQAHLMLGWLFIFFVGGQVNRIDITGMIHNKIAISNEVRKWDVLWIWLCLSLVDFLRGFSVVSSLITMLLYEMYHHAGAVKRWKRPQTGIRPKGVSLRRLPWSLFDLSAILGGILFGIIPLFHAQFLHLFTSTLTYTVSVKSKAASAEPVKAPYAKSCKN